MLETALPYDEQWPCAMVKADGDRMIVIYIPSRQPAGQRLAVRLGQEGSDYISTLFNPRTGRTRRLPRVVNRGGVLPLPAMPDAQDWVLILRKA